MLSRLSQIFMTFLTSRFEGMITAAVLAVAQQFLVKGKKTLLMLISCFVLSILLTAGIIISTLEAAAQYDARGNIFFTALLTSSLIMIGVSLLALTVIFWPRQQTKLAISEFANSQAARHPFEEILTAAVAEGVQHFKNKARSRSAEYSQT